MTPELLNQLRRDWFSEVSRKVLPPRVLARFAGLSDLEPITCCTVVLGVGAGHLLGVDVADLTFGNLLTEDEATTLVNTGWRGGDVDPDFAAWLMPSILSLLWAARRYENWEDSEIGSWFAGSHLERRISEAWGEGWARERDFESRLAIRGSDSPDHQSMDELYTWLCVEQAGADWLMTLTPLEARLLGADPARDAAREALESARVDLYLWLSAPGSWPRSPGDMTPRWLRDTVATGGARLWRASTGYVLTLTVVVETNRDERSLQRWCYQPDIGIQFPADSSVDLFMVLDADDDPAYLPFSFAYDDYRTAQ
ncbi:hypothetical protein ACFWHR_09345 [Leucobacter sp. NPDC058333]|uniref:hypothetical protein n=1 Tax=Leucobacter sp. NPDC058333 TaxID=3346450 RepID=UPI003656D85E